jgi:hypothetical protein
MVLSLKLFVTTVTELIAMAAPASIGFSMKPVRGSEPGSNRDGQ